MSRKEFLRLSLLSITLACATFGVVFAQSEPTDIGVDWAGLFNSDGSLRDDFDDQGAPGANGIADAIDVYGGIDAVFIEDRTSGGAVMDTSALQRASVLADFFVFNGLVAAPDDVGNGYVLARLDGTDQVLDFRVERLLGGAGASASYVEIELNQDSVGTRAGRRWSMTPYVRWEVEGRRSVGDLLIRVNLVGETVSSVQFKRWDDVGAGPGYQSLHTVDNPDAAACFGLDTDYAFCSGLLASGEGIANGDPEQIYEPDSYLEFSVNLGQLLGANPDYTTVQVCSAQDIAFGTFKAFGRYASN